MVIFKLVCFPCRFDEVCRYTFGKQGPQTGTSHFTQLVWKGSTELGIGKASNTQPDGATCTFIVARYNPQGNFQNDDNAYVNNVEKGSFDERYCSHIEKPGLEGGYGLKRSKGNWFLTHVINTSLVKYIVIVTWNIIFLYSALNVIAGRLYNSCFENWCKIVLYHGRYLNLYPPFPSPSIFSNC